MDKGICIEVSQWRDSQRTTASFHELSQVQAVAILSEAALELRIARMGLNAPHFDIEHDLVRLEAEPKKVCISVIDEGYIAGISVQNLSLLDALGAIMLSQLSIERELV